MLWPTIILLEIDDAKTPRGALNGLIKIKKEESKYGGGGLLHFAQTILIQNNKGIRFGGWCSCRRLVSIKTLGEECSTSSPHCSPAGETSLIPFCRGSCRTVPYQKWGKKDLHRICTVNLLKVAQRAEKGKALRPLGSWCDAITLLRWFLL